MLEVVSFLLAIFSGAVFAVFIKTFKRDGEKNAIQRIFSAEITIIGYFCAFLAAIVSTNTMLTASAFSTAFLVSMVIAKSVRRKQHASNQSNTPYQSQ